MIKGLGYLLLMNAALITACGSSENKKEKPAAKAASNFIEAIIVEKGKVTGDLKIPGELTAYQQVDLYAKVSSFIKKLYADVGSEVKQGQLLAVMEAPELNSQLSGAESKLRSQEAIYLSSKATYERLLETSKTPGTISPNDLDIAKARQNSDLAQLEAARAAYREVGDTRNYLEIRAPFSGVITARNVSAGAYVGPSGKGSEMPIFTLQEQEHLRLVVSVPEAYSGSLHENDAVKFSVKSIPHEMFTAKVTRMAGALDTRLRSERIEMDVINKNKQLLPGMVAEVDFALTSTDSSYLVPSSGVLNSTLGVFVIKVKDNKTIWMPVKTGNTSGKITEVSGNIQSGDTLVKFAVEEIRNNAPVTGIKISR
ncbi:MAG: efflux RND transporter periplasmic adaptor subunit [Chitinophagaceae bacterium]|nr:efflux RND transporter periplasmic adaptor subunit [Chitinophagaceae bacterium]